MAVTHYHRRRWDEPHIPVQVRHNDRLCSGELEAQRKNDGQWEAWVRLLSDGEYHPICGWFAWTDLVLPGR